MIELINVKKENNYKIYKILGFKMKFKNKNVVKNLKEFAQIIGAKLPSNINFEVPFKRVLTQSPYVTSGDFVIDAGWYNSDEVILESLKKGATAIFCSPEVKERYPQENVFSVDDPMGAVQKFEEWITRGCKAKRIAITGSVGKTTTTGLVNAVVANSFNTLIHDPMANSHGAILRMAQELDLDHKYWVQEVGGAFPNYIESSARFLRPDIVIFTNVSIHHIDLYKTRENIFKDKTSLEKYAKKGAKVIINYDDDMLLNANFSHNVITYSIKDPRADYYAKNITMDKNGLSFTAVCKKKREINVKLNLLGEFNAYNALCAIAVGEIIGIKLEQIPALLETYYPSGMRQNHISIGGYSIFVDAFNAEPQTVFGAAKILEDYKVPKGGKKVFVTGHIDRLGDDSAQLHKKLGNDLAKLKIDTILVYSGDGEYIYQGLKEAGFKNAILMESRDDLDNWIKNNLTRKDEIFFKAGQLKACLAKTIDNVFGTTLQNALQYNNGYSVERNNYKFHIRKDNIAEITGYTGNDTEILIPSNYEDNISTRISFAAFAKNSKITSVIIPDSIKTIRQEAFFRCKNLKSVKLPQSLLYIDKYAFNSCTKLEEIEIPKNVIHIDRRAFYDCYSLKKAIIHENVGFIGEDAFKNVSNDFVMFCQKDSYAEQYAKENNIKVSYL